MKERLIDAARATAFGTACLALTLALPAVAQTEQQALSNLKMAEKKYGVNNPQTAEFLFAVGNYYHQNQQRDKEQQYYGRALAIFQQHPGNHADLLRYYSDQLARIDAEEGNNTEAERLYKRSISLADQLPGKDKTYVVPNTLEALARLYSSEKRYSEAECALKQRIDMRHRFMNAGQVDIALVDLANLYVDWGKYDQAKPLFDQLLHISPMPATVRESYSAFLTKSGTKS